MINFKLKNSLISLLAGMSLFLAGCQKSPINGNLDGFWQVMDVIPAPEQIIIPERLYYGFNLHVCNLTYYGGGEFTFGSITYNDHVLTIDFPYISPTNENLLILRQYGVTSLPVVFEVEFMNKNSMILKNEESTVVLRRF